MIRNCFGRLQTSSYTLCIRKLYQVQLLDIDQSSNLASCICINLAVSINHTHQHHLSVPLKITKKIYMYTCTSTTICFQIKQQVELKKEINAFYKQSIFMYILFHLVTRSMSRLTDLPSSVTTRTKSVTFIPTGWVSLQVEPESRFVWNAPQLLPRLLAMISCGFCRGEKIVKKMAHDFRRRVQKLRVSRLF